VAKTSSLERISIPQTISWADKEKDLSAWRGNSMQFEALIKIYELEEKVKSANNPGLTSIWRNLQTSDHFYYMSTKGLTDGEVHNYFSHFSNPHDAYRYYMNVLSDFEIVLDKKINQRSLQKS
jgi:alpha-amylase